jgi:predicted P-loop ATPase
MIDLLELHTLVEEHTRHSHRVYAAAKWYVQNGFALTVANDKKELPKSGYNYSSAICTESGVDEIWGPGGKFEGWNVGFASGPGGGVSVIDLDVKPDKGIDGRNEFVTLCEMYGRGEDDILINAPRQTTPSGGMHILVQHRYGLTCTTNKIEEGIDTRGHATGSEKSNGGHFLVYPSVLADGGQYRWVDFKANEVPPCPEWIIELMRGTNPVLSVRDMPDVFGEGERDDGVYTFGKKAYVAALRAGRSEEECIAAYDDVADRMEPYDESIRNKNLRSIQNSKIVKNESVIAVAVDSGELIKTDKGKIIPCNSNIQWIFRHTSFFTEDVPMYWDSFRRRTILEEDEEAPIDDIYVEVCAALEKKYGIFQGTRQLVRDNLEKAVKEARPIDSLEKYIRELEWDRVDRRKDFYEALGITAKNRGFQIGLQGDFEETRELERIYLDKWMLSGVARALEPGCKVDSVLTLAGRQGCGKSTFARMITPHEYPHSRDSERSKGWFTDTIGRDKKLSHPDEIRKLVGTHVVEFAEMDALRKSEVTEMKVFISETDAKIVPKYREGAVSLPRRCIYIGTTNRYDYLTDTTGNRRFMNIDIGNFQIDTDWVLENRDQLWAQYKAIYDEGEAWFLSADQMKTQANANNQYLVTDDWTGLIEDWTRDKSKFYSKEIYKYALSMEPKDMGYVAQDRVKKIMSIIDDGRWQHKQVRVGSDRKAKLWVNPRDHINELFNGTTWLEAEESKKAEDF